MKRGSVARLAGVHSTGPREELGELGELGAQVELVGPSGRA
ncbi:hypothetical protein [Enhygromyxa salina]|nr:hypothetical protein [Enhygromyxa salina]